MFRAEREQQLRSGGDRIPPEHINPPDWKFHTNKHLDVYSIFDKFWRDAREYGLSQAKTLRGNILLANLRSKAQESSTAPILFPTAILVEESDGEIIYSHAYHKDIKAGNEKELQRIADHRIRKRFQAEHNAYYAVWSALTDKIKNLIGTDDTHKTTEVLLKHGFIHKTAQYSLYREQKQAAIQREKNRDTDNDTINRRIDDESLFDPISGVLSRFPELHEDSQVEVLYSPYWHAFISPNAPEHQNGETSIARLSRLMYIPKINKFFVADEGLYTGFHEEIRRFLALDEQQREIPTTEFELLAFIAVLSREYASLAPHAIFQKVIDEIGYLTRAPVGENVSTKEYRTITNQVSYAEQVIDFEYERCLDNPSLLETLEERLDYAATILLHATLRANESHKDFNVKKLFETYVSVFQKDIYALNPRGAKKLMNAATISAYPDFLNRAESLADCAIGSLNVGGMHELPMNNLAQGGSLALGAEFAGKSFTFETLLQGIEYRREHDFATEIEARAFAELYGIDPNWIGSVIQHYPGGKYCEECKHTMHWVGQCGDHTMCLQCNAEYNLRHGLVPGLVDGGATIEEIRQLDTDGQQIIKPRTIGLGQFVAGLGNPNLYSQVFLIQTIMNYPDHFSL